MVRGLLLCWMLWPLVVWADASPRLWLELESRQVALGQPLHGVLQVQGIGLVLSGDDLAPLERDFYLADSGPYEAQEEGGRLPFTLFPRNSGTIILPPLQIRDVRSEAQSIEVTPAQANGVPLAVNSQVSTTTPWVRQQVLITLEVITSDRFSRLVVESPELPGFEVLPLDSEREQVETPHGERTRLRTGYALFALTPGKKSLRLPLVGYRLDGGTRRHFVLPEPELEVKALPPYVPPTLPVGRVVIESSLQTEGMLYPEELAILHLRLKAPMVPPHWLPPLHRRLVDNEKMRYLPAQSDYSAAPDGSGVNALAEHRIPLSTLAQGWLDLPTLELNYFDPVTGRLDRAIHQPPCPLVLGLAARLTLVLFVVVLLWKTVPELWCRVRTFIHCRREQKAALDDLARAQDTAALRAALRRYAAAVGGSANITLAQIQQQLEGVVGPETINDLSLASYAAVYGGDVSVLRATILEQLREKHFLPIGLCNTG